MEIKKKGGFHKSPFLKTENNKSNNIMTLGGLRTVF